MAQDRQGTFDLSAIAVSALCLAHCAALPLVAASLPVLASWLKVELVHFLFVGLAAPLSIFALSDRQTRDLLSAAMVGLLLLLAGALTHGPASVLLTLLGGAVIATAHIVNWRRRELAHRHRPI